MQHWADIFQSLHMSICQEACIAQWKFWKTSIRFHVPSLPKWQKVLEVFRNNGRSITDENCFNFLLSRHCFSKQCSFTKISIKFLSFDDFLLELCNQKYAAEIQWNTISYMYCRCVANIFVCSSFYNLVAVFVNGSQNWDKS